MSEWVAYTGSDEQIAEMIHAKNGYILKNRNRESDKLTQGFALNGKFRCKDDDYEEYWPIEECWIIPDDPLREIKVRQAMTGQPVWVRYMCNLASYPIARVTTSPNWNIPNAEYSFAAFEE